MPKKNVAASNTALQVQQHAAAWGSRIRAQRICNRITSANLAKRIGVSQPTVSRLEKGDQGVSLAAYLAAFYALGLMNELAPLPDAPPDSDETNKRVRLTRIESGEDFGYF